MGVYLIGMVRSVETKRMRGTKVKNRMTGRIQIRILIQHPLKGLESYTITHLLLLTCVLNQMSYIKRWTFGSIVNHLRSISRTQNYTEPP
jgi:hypothetical protein